MSAQRAAAVMMAPFSMDSGSVGSPRMWQRKLKLKAKFKSGSSYFTFKR